MNLNSLFVKSIKSRSELINYQTFRWKRIRKPFWLGIAKSKMFKIPQPRVCVTKEERKVNKELNDHYKTLLKSTLKFIREDNPRLKTSIIDDKSENNPYLLEKIAESFKNNESWNAESARRREERMKKTMEVKMEVAIKHISIQEKKRKQEMERVEQIVRAEKEKSKAFITPENLDEAIEKCLDEIKNYDFAIDLEGNRYTGRETLRPPSVFENQQQMVEESVQ